MTTRNLLLAIALLLIHVPNAACQYVRMSWGTCAPQVADMIYTAPITYTIVMSATGVSGSIIGHDSEVTIGPLVPDAWRFDDGGCQAMQLQISNSSLTKTCPTLKGANALAITNVAYESAGGLLVLRLALTFDQFTPAGGTRYTMWQLAFNHSNSVFGVDSDSSTCDNAGMPLDIQATSGVLTSSGNVVPLLPELGRKLPHQVDSCKLDS